MISDDLLEHEATIEKYGSYLREVGDPEVQSLLQRHQSILQQHYQELLNLANSAGFPGTIGSVGIGQQTHVQPQTYGTPSFGVGGPGQIGFTNRGSNVGIGGGPVGGGFTSGIGNVGGTGRFGSGGGTIGFGGGTSGNRSFRV